MNKAKKTKATTTQSNKQHESGSGFVLETSKSKTFVVSNEDSSQTSSKGVATSSPVKNNPRSKGCNRKKKLKSQKIQQEQKIKHSPPSDDNLVCEEEFTCFNIDPEEDDPYGNNQRSTMKAANVSSG